MGKEITFVIIVVLICSVFADANINEKSMDDSKSTLFFVLEGIRSNSNYFVSGQGKFAWSFTGMNNGEYMGYTDEISTSGDFAFSDRKLRWDKATHISQEKSILEQNIADGKREIQCMEPFEGVHGNLNSCQFSDAYLRHSNTSIGGRYISRRVDIKHMAEPIGLPLETLELIMEGKSLAEYSERHGKPIPDHLKGKPLEFKVLNTIESPEGFYVITIDLKKMDGGDEFKMEYTFDPAKGFNIIKEVVYLNELPHFIVKRSFSKYNGHWFLKTFEHTLYESGSFEIPTGRSSLEVNNFEANISIPEETFKLEGLNVIENVTVHDHVAGVTYRPYCEALLAESLDQLSQELDGVKFEADIKSYQAVNNADENKSKEKVVPFSQPEKIVCSATKNYWYFGAIILFLILLFLKKYGTCKSK